ncbi:MAG: sensor histidine kinase [Pseudomonadota bacterium]
MVSRTRVITLWRPDQNTVGCATQIAKPHRFCKVATLFAQILPPGNVPLPASRNPTFLARVLLVAPVLLLGLSSALSANVLPLDPSQGVIDPAPHLAYFEDVESSMTIHDAMTQVFTPMAGNTGFGYSQSTFWYRVRITNPESEAVDWVLRTGVRFMRPVHIYVVEGGNARLLLKNNEHEPFDERQMGLRHLAAPLTVPGHASLDIYVAFKAGGAAAFPFFFMRPAAMAQQDTYEHVLTSAVAAILGTLIIVNFLHFVFSREWPYLTYCLQEFAILAYLLHIEGYGFQFLWPQYPAFNALASPLLGALTIFSAIAFTSQFLELRTRHPQANKVLLVFAGFCLVVAATLPWLGIRLANQATIAIASLSGLLLVYCALRLSLQGFKPAHYFFAAWLVRVVTSASVTYAFFGFGEAPEMDVLDGLKIGIALQGLIFSVGLALRYRNLAREHAQNRERLVRNLNLRLGEAVELAQSEQDKEHAVRQAMERSRSMAATGHDLAQPINALKLAISQLQTDARDLQLKDTVLDTLNGMQATLNQLTQEASGRLRQVTEDSVVDVAALLTQISLEFRQEASTNGIFIRVYAHKGRWPLSATSLRRCLSNLVSNGLRYTDQGGLLLSARQYPDRLLVQVWDTGCGMTPNQVINFQQEFERDPQSPGHGLGLAIVREICNTHGWDLQIQSRENRGTRVSISIPAPTVKRAKL